MKKKQEWTDADYKIKDLICALLYHNGLTDIIILGALGSWKAEIDDKSVLRILEQANSGKPFEIIASAFKDDPKNN